MTSTRPFDTTQLSTREAARRAGVSFRQADYWVRTGAFTIGDDTPGKGNPRRWSEEDVTVLRILGRVSAALSGTLDRSVLTAVATKARELIANDWVGDPIHVELTSDVQLVVETA